MKGMELLFLTEIQHYTNIFSITKSLELWGYDFSRKTALYGIIIGMGVLFRIIGFLSLYFLKPTSYIRIAYDWIKAKLKVNQKKINEETKPLLSSG
jgi:hypothetical protein